MREGPAIAAVGAAVLIAAGAAHATPPAEFELDVPSPCVVGSCSIGLIYDTSLLSSPVTVTITIGGC